MPYLVCDLDGIGFKYFFWIRAKRHRNLTGGTITALPRSRWTVFTIHMLGVILGIAVILSFERLF